MKTNHLATIYFKYIDSLLLSLLYFMVFSGIIIIPLGFDGVSSLFHKASLALVLLWFIIKIINCVILKKIKVFIFDKQKSVPLLFAILVITFSFCGVFWNLIQENVFPLSFNYYSKLFIFSATVLFIYLLYSSRFTKMPFVTLKTLVVLTSIILILVFALGIGRKWAGLSQWKLLTLNFSNPNTASIVLTILSSFLTYMVFTSRSIISKSINIVLFVALFLLNYLTSCRAGLIATASLFAFSVLFKIVRKRINIIIYLIVLSTVLFAVCYFLFFTFSAGGNYYVNQAIQESGKSFSTRYGVWADSLRLLSYNPFVGNYYSASNGTGIFQLHNVGIDIIVSYGMLSYILLVIFLFLILIKTFKLDLNKNILPHHMLSFGMMASIFSLGLFESFPFYAPNGTGLIALSSIALFNVPFGKSVFEEQHDNYNDKKTCDVLIINNVFKYGSTGKIVESLHTFYRTLGLNSLVIYGRNESTSIIDGVSCVESLIEIRLSQLINRIFKTQHIGYWFMTREIVCAIKHVKPKIIHIHGLNDDYVNYLGLLSYLSKKCLKVVYTNHSEYMYLGNCGGHSFECNKFINNECNSCPLAKTTFERFVAKHEFSIKRDVFSTFCYENFAVTSVSPWLCERSSSSMIFKRFRNYVVLNGTNLAKASLPIAQSPYNEKNVILYVTPSIYNINKGFNFFVELANRCLDNKSLSFVVLTLDNNVKINNKNINIVNNVTDSNILASYYYNARLLITASRRETFSMPVIESLCCGTPVVGFKSGGPESIALYEYTSFVDYSDVDALYSNMISYLNKSFDKNQIIEKAKKHYNNEAMCNNYIKIYKELDKSFGVNLVSTNSNYVEISL